MREPSRTEQWFKKNGENVVLGILLVAVLSFVLFLISAMKEIGARNEAYAAAQDAKTYAVSCESYSGKKQFEGVVEDYYIYNGTVFLYSDNSRTQLIAAIVGQCKVSENIKR